MHPLLENYFGVIKRFLPDDSVSSVVGLDIGTSECKFVELIKEDDGYQLLNWQIQPVQKSNIGDTIKQGVDAMGIEPENLYTAVFGKGTLIRYIDLPRMSLKDLKNSFAIEADKYFPFAQDQIYTDCYILDPEGKGSKMSVMATATKKELVDERIKLLSDLGYNANFIGLNSIALANVLNVLGVADKNNNACMALLDMGESVSSLTIFINSMPRFTRDIFIGGQELTKRISNALDINFEQAEQLKCQPNDRIEEIINACDSTIMNLVQELKLSFDYFASERNQGIETLLLTGGASMLKGLPSALEKHLDLEVRNWDPISSVALAENINPSEVASKSLKLGVALGLGLYHYA